ncbi:hypothetical protein HY439_03445 [Candidatus Microgenomates bacterium]|nr:hypothetical protein [Candidatus Microgenomates bacterium]
MDDLPLDQQSTDKNQPSQPSALSMGREKEMQPPTPYLKRTEERPEITSELQEAGVEHLHEEVELSPQDKEAGMIEAAEAVPVTTEPTGLVSLPLTEDQIKKALHHKIIDSVTWLATWCFRQIKIFHHRIKA